MAPVESKRILSKVMALLYLAVVIDLFSRMVIEWYTDSHMKTSLINDVLFMTLKQRHPQKGLTWHIDRGS